LSWRDFKEKCDRHRLGPIDSAGVRSLLEVWAVHIFGFLSDPHELPA